MEKAAQTITVLILISFIAGCGSTERINGDMISRGAKGVFSEINGSESAPENKAILAINLSFKTHTENHYLFSHIKSHHGKPTYRVMVDIDGQTTIWIIPGIRETTALKDKNSGSLSDPEAGDGMRYQLRKKIILSPGTHKVFFSLPDDDYYREFVINAEKGDENKLEFKPVYIRYANRMRPPSFYNGFKEFRIHYNSVCCLE